MPLKKAPYWTDLYYRVVEHYFWSPQYIGKKKNPDVIPKPWSHWKDKLQSQETPLNHILDLLFHIAPEELLDRVVSTLIKRQIFNLRLVAPTPGTIDDNIVQPDIIISNPTELVFIEMKVDSKSSIDQFAKYAIAAHCIVQDEPQISSVDLVLLTRYTDPQRVWKHATKLGLTSERAVREVALRALQHDPKIWSEAGVQSYTRSYPQAIPSIAKQVMSMGLHLTDYGPLEIVLRDYAAEEIAVSRLIHGVLEEFKRRNLLVR